MSDFRLTTKRYVRPRMSYAAYRYVTAEDPPAAAPEEPAPPPAEPPAAEPDPAAPVMPDVPAEAPVADPAAPEAPAADPAAEPGAEDPGAEPPPGEDPAAGLEAPAEEAPPETSPTEGWEDHLSTIENTIRSDYDLEGVDFSIPLNEDEEYGEYAPSIEGIVGDPSYGYKINGKLVFDDPHEVPDSIKDLVQNNMIAFEAYVDPDGNLNVPSVQLSSPLGSKTKDTTKYHISPGVYEL